MTKKRTVKKKPVARAKPSTDWRYYRSYQNKVIYLRTDVSKIKGSFIAYKKVINDRGDRLIATLLITDTIRMSPQNSKCRSPSALVLGLHTYDKYTMNPQLVLTEDKVAFSSFDPKFKYEVGQEVRCVGKFAKEHVECASGIHYFLTAKKAIDYNI